MGPGRCGVRRGDHGAVDCWPRRRPGPSCLSRRGAQCSCGRCVAGARGQQSPGPPRRSVARGLHSPGPGGAERVPCRGGAGPCARAPRHRGALAVSWPVVLPCRGSDGHRRRQHCLGAFVGPGGALQLARDVRRHHGLVLVSAQYLAGRCPLRHLGGPRRGRWPHQGARRRQHSRQQVLGCSVAAVGLEHRMPCRGITGEPRGSGNVSPASKRSHSQRRLRTQLRLPPFGEATGPGSQGLQPLGASGVGRRYAAT